MKFIVLALAAIIICSCNPMQRLNIINKSNGDAEVIWEIKEDSLLQSPLFISNSKKVKFHLKNKAPYNKVTLSVGKSSWSPHNVYEFSNDLESLSLQWNSHSLKLSSADSIARFLSMRRRGLDKSKIYLILK